jgi:A/G-specific adenine glycosylase
MLQQTQVITVIPYYERWMRAFPSVRMLAVAPGERVLKLWEGLGYYRRARNLQAAARVLVDRWNGNFPSTFEGLLSLPGVGRYTAGAVGSIALGLRAPVLDGNVARVLARFLGIREPVKAHPVQARLWKIMEEWLPERNPGDFNQAMMELGATVCLPKSPHCERCPLRDACEARKNKWQDQIPRIERPQAVDRSEFAVVARDGARIWLEQRERGEWHHGLWALPSVLRETDDPAWAAELKKRYGWSVREAKPACSVRYQVTRHRVALRVYEVLPQRAKGASSRLKSWTREEAAALPLVTAHRRSLEKLRII